MVLPSAASSIINNLSFFFSWLESWAENIKEIKSLINLTFLGQFPVNSIDLWINWLKGMAVGSLLACGAALLFIWLIEEAATLPHFINQIGKQSIHGNEINFNPFHHSTAIGIAEMNEMEELIECLARRGMLPAHVELVSLLCGAG